MESQTPPVNKEDEMRREIQKRINQDRMEEEFENLGVVGGAMSFDNKPVIGFDSHIQH